ncbi:MAG: hypothetical protein WDA09_09105 [Bacteriovoracaceae bacterium]
MSNISISHFFYSLVADAETGVISYPINSAVETVIKFACTSVQKKRFERTMDSLANSLVDKRELNLSEIKSFFEWINSSEKKQSFFHDTMRAALHTNSVVSQVAIGILVARSYKQFNIDFETSVLYRALDGLDDFEVDVLLDFLQVSSVELRPGEYLKYTKEQITELANIRQTSVESIKNHLHITINLMCSNRILSPMPSVYSTYKHTALAQINSITLLTINLMKEAKAMIDSKRF